MSNSTDIPSNDTFNQIADVFLTTPSVVSDHSKSEDLRYPPLNLDHDDTNYTASASLDTPVNKAPSSSQKSTVNHTPHLTLTEEPSGDTVILPSVDDEYREDHPNHTPEDNHPLTSAQVDNLLSHHTDSESTEQFIPSETNLSLLYACHLPVQGQLWYGQLAEASAMRFGSTCFIRRLGDDSISADFIPARSDDDPSPTTIPNLTSQHKTQTSTEQIIRSVLPFTKHWLLHVRNIEEINDVSNTEEITPKRVILATSTDPAAMVGVYRTLKTMVEKLGPDTTVDLILIGTEHKSAEQAFARISSAARGFLNREVSCIAILPKIDPISITHLGVFPYLESSTHLNGFATDMSQIIHDANALAITQTEADEVNPFDDEMTISNEEDILDTSNLNESPKHKPDTVVEATGLMNDNRATPPKLVTIVPELTDLIARSPKAPDVELAIDADGCVHALCTDTRDDHSYCEDDCNPVASLLSVCDWIENHSSIIRLLRSFPISQSSEMENSPHSSHPLHTQAHLFTAHPQQYRRLMDGRLRIHLLAPVEEIVVDSNDQNTDHHNINHHQPRWVHVPVN